MHSVDPTLPAEPSLFPCQAPTPVGPPPRIYKNKHHVGEEEAFLFAHLSLRIIRERPVSVLRRMLLNLIEVSVQLAERSAENISDCRSRCPDFPPLLFPRGLCLATCLQSFIIRVCSVWLCGCNLVLSLPIYSLLWVSRQIVPSPLCLSCALVCVSIKMSLFEIIDTAG